MTTLLFALAAYLIGSVPFAVITSRVFGLADPRTYGSGNPGATNVLRGGNKLAALFTLLGDGAKGWLAVWLAARFGVQLGAEALTVAVVALSVFLGHVFPLFLGFKGGKGVATAAGVLLALSLVLGLTTLGVWLVVVALFRYSSLAGVVAAVVAPFAALMLFGANEAFVAVTVMSVILVLRHAENIKRLMAGQEGKIGGKRTPQGL